MSTLRALLRKDLPWLSFFLIGGTVGHVLVLFAWSFVHTFVVSPGQREELFHVAWSCGMGLGVVAFAFDEVLGTRDFLAQRHVTTAVVMRARFVGCAIVLIGWMLLAPAAAYLLMALDTGPWEWGHWQQLPSVLGNMLPAWSGCALAALATSLPFAWWARLLCLGAMFLLSFSAIFWCERDAVRGLSSWSPFVAGHVAVAVVASSLAWWCRGGAGDADRPLEPRARRTAVVPMLVVGGLAVAVGLTMLESNAVARLRNEYPRVLRHAGHYVLAVRPDWEEPWIVVDAQHVATGQRLESAKGVDREGSYIDDDFVRIEAPREGVFTTSGIGPDGRILLDVDGTPWWQVPGNASLRRLAKSPTEPRFARRSRADTLAVGPQGTRVIVVVEPSGEAVWLFRSATAAFERVALADGDRNSGRVPAGSSSIGPLGEPIGLELARGEDLIRGQQFVYALRDGRLHKVGKAEVPAIDDGTPSSRVRLTDVDGLGWMVEVDAGMGAGPFRHRFQPRTFAERTYAGFACLLSAMRPPAMQLIAAFGPVTDHEPGRRSRWHWLFDPLVAEGRRWWLVGLCMALAALLTWKTRRRLRRLGADALTIRFWSLATLLLGPLGALSSVLCERPRAWTDRGLAIPAAGPRIASLDPVEEHVA